MRPSPPHSCMLGAWLIIPLINFLFFPHQRPCSTWWKSGTGIWYPTTRLIPGDLCSACLHRQFHSLPGFLYSQISLPNSYTNACVPSREAVCTIFSHTQWLSVTLAIRLCPLLSAWTFLVFRLLSNRFTDLLQILCGCSLGGPLVRLLKSGCYPYFSWNYG